MTISTRVLNRVAERATAARLGVDDFRFGQITKFSYVDVEEQWSTLFFSGVQKRRLYTPSIEVKIGKRWYGFLVPIILKKYRRKEGFFKASGEEPDEAAMEAEAKKMISSIKWDKGE